MFWQIVAILLFLTFVGIVIKLFYDIISLTFAHAVSVVKRYQSIKASHRAILKKYSAFYNMLNGKDKVIFEKRLQRFMHSKRFIPRGVDRVTDEMRVLISATAIQMTFGLGRVFLSHFDKILIYMDAYYSHITQKYHLGEVNPRAGMIIISWKSFVDGFANLNDSLNLGIHEMAHAIHFENKIRNEEFEFLDSKALQKLENITAVEMVKIQDGDPHFFRSYAGTNEYEFFAVALEYFFEKPVELNAALPELYSTLVMLLNQDPMKLYKLAA